MRMSFIKEKTIELSNKFLKCSVPLDVSHCEELISLKTIFLNLLHLLNNTFEKCKDVKNMLREIIKIQFYRYYSILIIFQ